MDGYLTQTLSDQKHPDRDLERVLLSAIGGDRAIGIALLDADLRVLRSNIDPERAQGLTVPPGSRLTDLVPAEDAGAFGAQLGHVLRTGEALLSHQQLLRTPGEVLVSMSALALPAVDGRPARLLVTFVNAARETRRIDLLFDAAVKIGASLDVAESARQLAAALVPALGYEAIVYLVRNIYAGEEPSRRLSGGNLGMLCAAVAPEDRVRPPEFIRPGMDLPMLPNTEAVGHFQRGEPYVAPDRAAMSRGVEDDPDLVRYLVPPDAATAVQTPLLARGLILGAVAVVRTEDAEPFNDEDLQLLQEVASRAALSIDNARRYTRERTASVALQRSLLPPASTDTAAVEAAGVYLPATAGGQGAGGDWYDVIPLSSLRVALVVGDVVGHGLRATATMGRLRTAVQALADLDLGPGELLTHLNDLVLRIGASPEPSHDDVLASTCLYAVYDPVARTCTMASAGHPPPGIIRPEGGFDFLDVEPGPPLGVGGLPFLDAVVDMKPGSLLALYTDGLVEYGHERDLAVGMDAFAERMATLHPGNRDLRATADSVVRAISPAGLDDDVTLLLARVRATSDDDLATWRVPSEPAAVTTARDLTIDRLTEWGLAELTFTTELIVSELITNAIRYAGGPIGLRLIRDGRDGVLVCEVSDPSNTQPRLRQARSTDEGGRGLFLVAQLADRWGSRFNSTGKTIWAEQTLPEPNGGS